MLFTRRGDNGKTKIFSGKSRLAKSSCIIEALGALDELNSLLGLIKVKGRALGGLASKWRQGLQVAEVLDSVQQNLFIIQAELASAPKVITAEKVAAMERVIADIEKKLPPIKSFFVPGGNELSAFLDFARAVARRAERRVVVCAERSRSAASKNSLAYLNRLSSLLYALARLINYESGIKEEAPSYE